MEVSKLEALSGSTINTVPDFRVILYLKLL